MKFITVNDSKVYSFAVSFLRNSNNLEIKLYLLYDGKNVHYRVSHYFHINNEINFFCVGEIDFNT